MLADVICYWKMTSFMALDGATLFLRLKEVTNTCSGGQRLSGRVLDSRPKGRGFEPHRRHYIVVLEQDTFILA